MKYSLIITAWKEPKTVSQNLEMILDHCNGNMLPDMEIILVCPDEDTFLAAHSISNKYKFQYFKRIQDKKIGKPTALNLAIKEAQGEILIFTDGDVIYDKSSLPNLVNAFDNSEIGAVTGRPVSADPKNTLFGYIGNLLADVAHHKRTHSFNSGGYYFLSGYVYAVRNFQDLKYPEKSLVDDAWITLDIIRRGYKLAYSPEARVFVKYPQNFTDWIKQKKRSVGGYRQLQPMIEQMQSMNLSSKSINRKFGNELAYFFFPLKYAKNLRQLFYSVCLYPMRLYLWLIIFYETHFNKKTFDQTWVRIESTK